MRDEKLFSIIHNSLPKFIQEFYYYLNCMFLKGDTIFDQGVTSPMSPKILISDREYPNIISDILNEIELFTHSNNLKMYICRIERELKSRKINKKYRRCEFRSYKKYTKDEILNTLNEKDKIISIGNNSFIVRILYKKIIIYSIGVYAYRDDKLKLEEKNISLFLVNFSHNCEIKKYKCYYWSIVPKWKNINTKYGHIGHNQKYAFKNKKNFKNNKNKNFLYNTFISIKKSDDLSNLLTKGILISI